MGARNIKSLRIPFVTPSQQSTVNRCHRKRSNSDEALICVNLPVSAVIKRENSTADDKGLTQMYRNQ